MAHHNKLLEINNLEDSLPGAWGVPTDRLGAVVALSCSEDRPVSISAVASATPLGIVIKTGGPSRKPVRFWAYLWAADEETSVDHWHQRVTTAHAA